jgi:hypothetical protein
MGPFGVIVGDILADRDSEMPLPEQDQPVEAFTYDRENKSLGECVEVGTASGETNRVVSGNPIASVTRQLGDNSESPRRGLDGEQGAGQSLRENRGDSPPSQSPRASGWRPPL